MSENLKLAHLTSLTEWKVKWQGFHTDTHTHARARRRVCPTRQTQRWLGSGWLLLWRCRQLSTLLNTEMLRAGVLATVMVRNDALYSTSAVAAKGISTHTASNVVKITYTAIPLSTGWTRDVAHAPSCCHRSTPAGIRCLYAMGLLKLRKQLTLFAELVSEALQLVVYETRLPFLSCYSSHLFIIEGCTFPCLEMGIGVLTVHLRTAAIAKVRTALCTVHVITPSCAVHTHFANRTRL